MTGDTRSNVYDAALALFRRRGFDRTTMRDVAQAAGMSLGAAYYYFPSKEAIVLSYYEAQQDKHVRLARKALARSHDLRARVGAVFHTKLDVLARDRKILGAVLRSVGDPADPLSLFGSATHEVRASSLRIFAEAIAAEPLDEAAREIVGHAFWALHMGLLLYFLYDDSPRQARTRRLTDGALDLLVPLVPLATSPAFAPLLAGIVAQTATLLREARLLAPAE